MPSRLLHLPAKLGVRLALLAMVTIVPLFGLLLAGAAGGRQHALDVAAARVLELAKRGAEQQDEALEQAAHLLQALARVPEVTATLQPRAAPDGVARCGGILTDVQHDYAQANFLSVLRPDGWAVCRSGANAEPLNLADRDWFQRTMRPGNRQRVVSGIIQGRISKRPVIIAAIPLAPFDADQMAAGALMISLDLEWFTQLSAQIAANRGEVAEVVDLADGRLVASSGSMPGSTEGLDPAMLAHLRSHGAGALVGLDQLGEQRVLGFAALPGAGREELATLVRVPVERVLAERNKRLKLGALIAWGALLLALATAAVLAEFTLSRPIRDLTRMAAALAAGDLSVRAAVGRRCSRELWQLGETMETMADALAVRDASMGRVQAELARSEEHYRLLAENTTDVIIVLDPSLQKRTYVSPSCREILGYSPEQMIAHAPGAKTHPSDRRALAAHLSTLRQGATAAEVTYRVRTSDGDWLWVQTSAKRLPAGGGIVARVRDVQARKTMEAALEEANASLRGLAMLDGLTGLANRRFFDEALMVEFRRGLRESTPLGLMMIDLDFFKLYNDMYGHLGGDECLRAVGGAIAAAVRRPADLVARYGGEELVVLLPNTDRTGAAAMGERIHDAVARLALEHAGNPAGVVTFSAGVASAVPGEALPHGLELVQAADRALYAAKAAGRNAVCHAWSEFEDCNTKDLFPSSV